MEFVKILTLVIISMALIFVVYPKITGFITYQPSSCEYNSSRSEYPNWNITSSENCVVENGNITLNGNLTIYGNLTFRNVSLSINMSSPFVNNVTIRSTGSLYLNNSSINATNASNWYPITSYGNMNVNNSNLMYVWNFDVQAKEPQFINSTLFFNGKLTIYNLANLSLTNVALIVNNSSGIQVGTNAGSENSWLKIYDSNVTNSTNGIYYFDIYGSMIMNNTAIDFPSRLYFSCEGSQGPQDICNVTNTIITNITNEGLSFSGNTEPYTFINNVTLIAKFVAGNVWLVRASVENPLNLTLSNMTFIGVYGQNNMVRATLYTNITLIDPIFLYAVPDVPADGHGSITFKYYLKVKTQDISRQNISANLTVYNENNLFWNGTTNSNGDTPLLLTFGSRMNTTGRYYDGNIYCINSSDYSYVPTKCVKMHIRHLEPLTLHFSPFAPLFDNVSVILRNDDVYALANATETIETISIQQNISALYGAKWTHGVIVQNTTFWNNQQLADYLKSLNKEYTELASHGYVHVSYRDLDNATAKQYFNWTVLTMQTYVNTTPKTFPVPYSEWNNDTEKIAVEYNFTDFYGHDRGANITSKNPQDMPNRSIFIIPIDAWTWIGGYGGSGYPDSPYMNYSDQVIFFESIPFNQTEYSLLDHHHQLRYDNWTIAQYKIDILNQTIAYYKSRGAIFRTAEEYYRWNFDRNNITFNYTSDGIVGNKYVANLTNANYTQRIIMIIPPGWISSKIMVRDTTNSTVISWSGGSVVFSAMGGHVFDIYQGLDNGASCTYNYQCVSNICCSNICAASCGGPAPPGGTTGGTTGGPPAGGGGSPELPLRISLPNSTVFYVNESANITIAINNYNNFSVFDLYINVSAIPASWYSVTPNFIRVLPASSIQDAILQITPTEKGNYTANVTIGTQYVKTIIPTKLIVLEREIEEPPPIKIDYTLLILAIMSILIVISSKYNKRLHRILHR